MPSFAPNTAARSHPMRPLRCISGERGDWDVNAAGKFSDDDLIARGIDAVVFLDLRADLRIRSKSLLCGS
jgi:hypothetical protein